ncbi:MAG TPA: hypothetical protein VF158_03295 [Longimicrobiales bacterium]
MRIRLAAIALVALATPAAAQQHDHDARVTGTGELPAGWHARLDRENASLTELRFVTMGDGLHATTGPAAIFWNPATTATGEFDARATFTQTKPSRHPEAYGLFIGGSALDGPAQDYVYFLVRQDGKFLVKHRAGSETHTLVPWTAHEAVNAIGDDGKVTNALEMRVRDAAVHFLVNGVEVTKLDRVPMLRTDGIVGLRVNHNLDVHIGSFEVAAAQGAHDTHGSH